MSDVKKLRKAARQAICCPSGICGATQPGWAENGPCSGCAAKYTANRAKAVLAAIDAAGFAVVPKVATPDMIAATKKMDIYWGYYADGNPWTPEDAYAAMLAAAPNVLP